MKPQILSVNHGELAFNVIGNSDPVVVLLHGFPMNHAVWEAQYSALLNSCTCVIPDLRIFGKSSDEFGHLSFDLLASDIAHLLSFLQVSGAHIIGVSLGGVLAMKLVADYPALAKSLVVMHTESDADDAEAKLRRDEQIKEVSREGVTKFVSSFAAGLFTEDTDSKVIKKLQAIMDESSEKAVIAGIKLLRDRADMKPLLATISCPILVIAGEKDNGSPPELLKTMSGMFKHGEFRLLKNTAHMSIMDKLDETT